MTPFLPSRPTTSGRALLLLAGLALSCGVTPPAPTATGENKPMTEASPMTDTSSAPRPNPLLQPFDTPFGVPPFDRIENADYLPALTAAMADHAAEVDRIAAEPEPPTFANTLAALDFSGQLLTRVSLVFFAKQSADTNDEVQAIAREAAPLLSAHADRIKMNPALFARVKAVYDARGTLSLADDELRLLELTWRDFVRGGALLDDHQKRRLMAINERLAVLDVQFADRLLAENNAFALHIENEEELAGLPAPVIAAAKEAAAAAGESGWRFTLHKPSYTPFMQYADHRGHRQTLFNACAQRGSRGDSNDNRSGLLEMVRLRLERARLLGYPTHADYVLEKNMAKNPAGVKGLLDQLWKPALASARKERSDLQALMKRRGSTEKLAPWDWFYFAQQLRQEKFNLSDTELRPYFALPQVQQGAFEVATRLYGLQFAPVKNVPTYHPDVQVFEVKEADGRHVGLLYLDYFPRPGKQQGAWMTEFRGQEIRSGAFIHPIVVNVFNFPPPSAGAPSLLNLEEVETLFHEFGHALHGLLSHVTWPSLSGTNVPRDFVELPSQFMENWCTDKRVLPLYAVHYETGAPMPEDLMARIERAATFNQGFATTEYLAASLLDMAWHTLTDVPTELDVTDFEARTLSAAGLIDEIIPRYRSPYFAHIFSGGYSSGYYSDIWSEVLDSDAFAAFEAHDDLFHGPTARAFRDHILAKGNTADPALLYRAFRGRDAIIDPLLKRRGLTVKK